MLASLKANPDLHFNPDAVSRVIAHPDKGGAALVFFSDGMEPIEFTGSASEVASLMNQLTVQQRVGLAQIAQQAQQPAPPTFQIDPARLRGENGLHR